MKRSVDQAVFSTASYLLIGIVALLCVFPFLVLVIGSFTSEHYIVNHGYALIPKELSLDAYRLVFLSPARILRAYGITIFLTGAGTTLSLFLSAMAAFVLYRKEVRHRNILAFFVYFTTLFSGGLASFYIIVSNYFKLRDTILVLLLVPMFSALYILILRNFIRGAIPESLVESAKIDGAGDFRVFLQIVLPLSKAALASIGLFTALGYWNDWWTPMLFINKSTLYPMQYVLYNILSSSNLAANIVNNVAVLNMPRESLKLALTVIAAGPIIFLYPFVQRYFVKGITLGSVKG